MSTGSKSGSSAKVVHLLTSSGTLFHLEVVAAKALDARLVLQRRWYRRASAEQVVEFVVGDVADVDRFELGHVLLQDRSPPSVASMPSHVLKTVACEHRVTEANDSA